MVNTNMFEFKHPKYYTELRKRNREVLRSGRGLAVNQAPHVSDQAISYEHSTESEGVRPGPGQSLTRDSNADGGEGSSSKHQASSNKLDMKDIMGYSINMIRLLIGQCAQAWNLQSSPPLKSRGVGGNSGLQAKPFFIYPKIQTSSGKRQAPSCKH